MQVSINATPVRQSRLPCSVSSVSRGGIETCRVTAPVVMAPSMRFPPRKHTRWSCLGVNRHELCETGIRISRFERIAIGGVSKCLHFTLRVTFRDEFRSVDHLGVLAPRNEVRKDAVHRIVVHLRFKGVV